MKIGFGYRCEQAPAESQRGGYGAEGMVAELERVGQETEVVSV